MDLKEAKLGSKKRHPWEKTRIRALTQILDYLEPTNIRSVLDIGCGDGYAASKIFESADIDRLVGVDSHFSKEQMAAVSNCHPRAVFIRELDSLAGQPFDLVLLLDVVEHIADDVKFLQAIVDEQLNDGGHVLITAPAFGGLFTHHDRFLDHYRRYNRSELQSLIAAAGLKIADGGFLFSSLLPIRVISKVLESFLPTLDSRAKGIADWRHGALTTRTIELILRADNRMLLALRSLKIVLPGLSVWALCKKQRQ